MLTQGFCESGKEKNKMSSDCSSTSKQQDKELSVLEAIQLHFDTPDLKKRVLKCHSNSITQWKDIHGLDLLHHCILENNLPAFIFLLNQGLFKPPHEPDTWPYLHLVSCLGLRTFISTIIQEIEYDNDAAFLDWDIYLKIIKVKISNCTPDLRDSERVKSHTPIDIAALFGHKYCVHLLLDFWQVHSTTRRSMRSFTKSSNPSYLKLACKVQSPNAVRLLLTENEDKKEALECAIKIGMPECVDVVLREGGFGCMKDVFQGMNLFHVVLSYRSFLTSEQYEDMVEIVSILVRHNQDVNAFKPSRTFPLYSLLSHVSVGCSIEKSSSYLIDTLLVLMNAGANPNFDEIFLEEKLQDKEQCHAFGRRPYASALNCLLYTLPRIKVQCDNASETELVDQYACRCIEILLRHGANLSLYAKYKEKSFYDDYYEHTYHEGTSLHVLISSRVRAFLSYPVLQHILSYGIDADTKGKWTCFITTNCIEYALNILPFLIYINSFKNPVDNPGLFTFTENDLKVFKHIMNFMSQRSLVLAYKEFENISKELKSSEKLVTDSQVDTANLDRKILSKISDEYIKQTRFPWKLQRFCANVIWRACRMHMDNIHQLSIPEGLRRIILNFH